MEWHPRSLFYPPIEGQDYEDFKEFIRRYPSRIEAVKFRILPNGEQQWLDGRNRVRACAELGLACPSQLIDVPDSEVEAYIDSLNLNRRHLGIEFRQLRVAALRSQGESVREIAKHLGVSPTTAYRDIVAVGQEGPIAKEHAAVQNETSLPLVKAPATKANRVITPRAYDMEDDKGHPIPSQLREIFSRAKSFKKMQQSLTNGAARLRQIEQSDTYKAGMSDRNRTGEPSCATAMIAASKRLGDIRPSLVCRDCAGTGCILCNRKGYLTREGVRNARTDG